MPCIRNLMSDHKNNMAADEPYLQPRSHTLPDQEICREALLEKYAKGDEELRRARCAAASRARWPRSRPKASRAKWEKRFPQAQEDGFIPAGRINSAAGVQLQATLINCFVQPVGDSISEIVDGKPGIYTALAEAAETMRRGGGVGYDFSSIRPKGARGEGHALARERPGVVHARVRPLLRNGGVGRRAPRRADGRAALRPPGHRGIHPRQGPGRPRQLQHLGRRDRRVHGRPSRTTRPSSWCTRPSPGRATDVLPARRRPLGLPQACRARELWDQIMRSTYDHAEPGILFLDRMNRDNNLYYCETIEATNPCAEQPLPPYGCCCLGSIDLTRFVRTPFHEQAEFDFEDFAKTVQTVGAHARQRARRDGLAARAAAQGSDGKAPRRPGLHRAGRRAHDAAPALRHRRGARDGGAISAAMRDEAYRASVELAKERGAFPLFNADMYLSGGNFAARLPEEIKAQIREARHPQLAPAVDRADRHHQPRVRRQRLERHRAAVLLGLHAQEAHGRRHAEGVPGRGPRLAPLQGRRRRHGRSCRPGSSPRWRSPRSAHEQMVAAVAPFIDTSISKTVNVPEDYPYEDFQDLYLHAWKSGLKGLATYRPNKVLGSVLSVGSKPRSRRTSSRTTSTGASASRPLPQPVLASLRWPGRPDLARRQPGLDLHDRAPALPLRGVRRPRRERPAARVRGLGERQRAAARPRRARQDAVDGHARQGPGLAASSSSRRSPRPRGDDAFDMPFPPNGEKKRMPSVVSAFAQLVRLARQGSCGALPRRAATPVLDAMFSLKEPKTGTDGTMSWTVDVLNPRTGDDFVLGLKEIALPAMEGFPAASRAPTPCGSRANTRARSTACASCCRSTCACSTRPGSA